MQASARPQPVGRWVGWRQRGQQVLRAVGDRARMPGVRLAVQVLMVALCLVPIGRQAAQDWGAVGALVSQLRLPAVLAAVLALILSAFFLPTAITAFTRHAASRISYRHSAYAYFASQPMKYLPGSFWILPGRVILLRGLGHDPSVASAALIFEMTAQALSCSLVSGALLGAGGFTAIGYQQAAWLILAGTLVVSALLLLSPAWAQRLALPAATRQALAQLAAVPLLARLRNFGLAILSYTIMWGLMGISFYALVVATDPHMDLALLKVAIGVSSLSWLAGFLTPFSPGGVGVREAAILLLLSPFMAEPQAVMVALLSRVLALAVELAFAAGVWLLLRSAQRKTQDSPNEASHPANPVSGFRQVR